jgi:hypothetical protein
MRKFAITARTAAQCIQFGALATSSAEADRNARALFGDEPCGITIICLE